MFFKMGCTLALIYSLTITCCASVSIVLHNPTLKVSIKKPVEDTSDGNCKIGLPSNNHKNGKLIFECDITIYSELTETIESVRMWIKDIEKQPDQSIKESSVEFTNAPLLGILCGEIYEKFQVGFVLTEGFSSKLNTVYKYKGYVKSLDSTILTTSEMAKQEIKLFKEGIKNIHTPIDGGMFVFEVSVDTRKAPHDKNQRVRFLSEPYKFESVKSENEIRLVPLFNKD
ncbi:hypothetical protein CDIK_2309 [Cucumispora dikerogammari]|nr:hypothetical protein CDIK_2309 [Cucumispora dikerogammari]